MLGKKVHYSQAYLAELIQAAVRSCPSALNSQSSRVVVLFGESHEKFWDIVKEVQRKLVAGACFCRHRDEDRTMCRRFSVQFFL